jgi:RNA polymerase sigma factor (sigma-70 family)
MSDEQRLVQEATLGDTKAFEELIAPILGKLTGWLNYVLDIDAEDCLQEVLLTAWLKLPSLKDPNRFQGWLFQLARNKCIDFLRKRKRMDQTEIPLDLVEGYLSRQPEIQTIHTFEELTELLTDAERTTIWLYYVDKLTIDQIAKQREVSTGTIKRLLFNARFRIRKTTQISREGEDLMTAKSSIILPEIRPMISIKPLNEVSFEVDFREDPWYFSVLEVGNKLQWAIYDPPNWRRTYAYNMKVIGKAVVHGEESLEIQVDEYESGSWKENSTRHYTQLGDMFIKHIAVLSYQNGIPYFDTFLDEHFHENWGQISPRFWKDDGRFQIVDESHFITANPQKTGGLGFYDVTIGENTFQCLRVLDTEWATGKEGILVEAYLSKEGRTVLFRRYNGEAWRPTSNWLETVNDNHRIMLDEVTYVHWYDCISNYVLK